MDLYLDLAFPDIVKLRNVGCDSNDVLQSSQHTYITFNFLFCLDRPLPDEFFFALIQLLNGRLAAFSAQRR